MDVALVRRWGSTINLLLNEWQAAIYCGNTLADVTCLYYLNADTNQDYVIKVLEKTFAHQVPTFPEEFERLCKKVKDYAIARHCDRLVAYLALCADGRLQT